MQSLFAPQMSYKETSLRGQRKLAGNIREGQKRQARCRTPSSLKASATDCFPRLLMTGEEKEPSRELC